MTVSHNDILNTLFVDSVIIIVDLILLLEHQILYFNVPFFPLATYGMLYMVSLKLLDFGHSFTFKWFFSEELSVSTILWLGKIISHYPTTSYLLYHA